MASQLSTESQAKINPKLLLLGRGFKAVISELYHVFEEVEHVREQLSSIQQQEQPNKEESNKLRRRLRAIRKCAPVMGLEGYSLYIKLAHEANSAGLVGDDFDQILRRLLEDC